MILTACCALAATILAPVIAAGAGHAEEPPPLRLCVDPTNLPFSSDEQATPGVYVEIGRAIAKSLARPVAYHWYKSYFGKRTVRETLLGRQCDLMVGLPLVEDFMGPAVIFSKPIGREGYALVSPKDRPVTSLDDLKGLRVAVQYQSTPQNLLASRDDITKVTVLSPQEGMKALSDGKADVAFVWGPVAGWLNRTAYADHFIIRSTDGEGLSWDVAIGFAKASRELKAQVDAVLPALTSEITALFAKYGVPADTPLRFGATSMSSTHVAAAEPSHAAEVAPTPVASASEQPIASVANASLAGNPEAGHSLFNGTCAHCHGPDAVQAERKIDLRLLKRRYGDSMQETFWKTVHEGRPAKGMPAWKEIFSDDELNKIYSYVVTVQSASN